MGIFLHQQLMRNEEHRRKSFRHWLLKVQRISLVVIVWFLFVAGIYGLYYLVFEYGFFTVKNIEVSGDFIRLTEAEVYEFAGIKIGSNIFSVKLKDIQKRLLSRPWVKEAAVARKFPGTIWIYVSEYIPFAVVVSNGISYVDKDGFIFKSIEPADDKNFPVLTGIVEDGDIHKAVRLLKIFMSSPLADYFEPAEINLNEVQGCSVVLNEGGTLIKLGAVDDGGEKLERLYSMLPALQSGRGKIKYIDLNVQGKVVAKYES